MRKVFAPGLVAVALAIAAAGAAAASNPNTLTLAVFGDEPYWDTTKPACRRSFTSATSIRAVRRAQSRSIGPIYDLWTGVVAPGFQKPLICTPGDNEWSD